MRLWQEAKVPRKNLDYQVQGHHHQAQIESESVWVVAGPRQAQANEQ